MIATNSLLRHSRVRSQRTTPLIVRNAPHLMVSSSKFCVSPDIQTQTTTFDHTPNFLGLLGVALSGSRRVSLSLNPTYNYL